MGRKRSKPKVTAKPAPVLMGIREYSRHRKELGLTGGTHRAVQVAIRDGRIVDAITLDGKIDAAIADEEWSDTTLEDRVPITGPTSVDDDDDDDDETFAPGIPKLKESRARREAAEAALAEIELAEKRGELVLARDVESKLVNVFAHCKTKLLAVPGRIRQSDPGMSDVQIDLIDSTIRETLDELVVGK